MIIEMPNSVLDLARQFFEDNIEKIDTIEVYSNAKNNTYKVTSAKKNEYIIKLFTKDENSFIKNVEPWIYKKFSNSKLLRKCYSIGSDEEEYDFIILDFIEGRTLFEVLSENDIKSLNFGMEKIANYIKYCASFHTNTFGNLNEDSSITYSSWFDFLNQYLLDVKNRIQSIDQNEILNEFFSDMYEFFEINREYFSKVQPCFVPIDLNLKNFLVSEDNNFYVLDVDAFWCGDWLLSVGEFVGHSYGTPYYHEFIKEFSLTKFEQKMIHFYALLCNMDVLLYIADNGSNSLETEKPFGNQITFFDLLRSHGYALKHDDFYQDGYFNCHVLKEKFDWGVKLSQKNDRTVSYEDTLARVDSVKHYAGITRISEVTGLDSTGVYAYQCMRPDAEENEGTFTVFSGKGTSKLQCKVSAIVEGIERFCAEKRNYHRDRIIVDSYTNLVKKNKVIHPKEFNLPEDSNYSEDEILEWVPGYDLITGETYYVTANTVFYPYKPESGRMLSRYFTTGLAAGNNYIESFTHGISEIIERDAAALNLILRNNPCVDIDTIKNEEILKIIRQIQSAQTELNIIIRYITVPDIKVPAFSVIIEDVEMRNPLFVSGGYAAHPNKDIALTSAINEAVLSRVSTISGAREDLEKFKNYKESMDYDVYRNKYKYWFNTDKKIAYDMIPTYQFPTLEEDLWYLCNCVKNAGFQHILYVDLSKEELGIPTVKMLIPGIERYSFHMTCVGNRAKKYYSSLYHKTLNIKGKRM